MNDEYKAALSFIHHSSYCIAFILSILSILLKFPLLTK
jgi:hypothetical protein